MAMAPAAQHAASGTPPKQCSVESNLALSSVRRISAAGAIAILAIALAVAPGASSAPNKVIPLDFDWSPTAPTPGQVVTFTAAANPPSGVAIRSYDWDLNGDGSIDKHGATATWSYPAPGPVSVRLHVTGDGNRRGDAVHTVSVQAAAAAAALSPFPLLLRSRSRPPRRSPISRCCSRPLPATPTAPSSSRSGISTVTATTTMGAAQRHLAPSPMPAATW